MSKSVELPYKETKTHVVIGPFDAFVRTQAEQRGVLIPKFYHDKDWFSKILSIRKPEIMMSINNTDFGPFNRSISEMGDSQRCIFIPKEYHDNPLFKKLSDQQKYSISITVKLPSG